MVEARGLFPKAQAKIADTLADIGVYLGHALIDFAPKLHPRPVQVEFGVSEKVVSFQ